LRAVLDALDARMLGAVGTAVKGAVVFDPVADHLAAAVRAGGCQRVDGALEGVKRLRPSGHRHGERLVVVVPAHVTLRHRGTLATRVWHSLGWLPRGSGHFTHW